MPHIEIIAAYLASSLMFWALTMAAYWDDHPEIKLWGFIRLTVVLTLTWPVVLFGLIVWRVFQWRWSNTQHPYLLDGRDR